MSEAEGLMDMANAALQTMVEDGDLQQAEYARMTIPTWDRTTAEFLEPFDSGEFDGTLELLRHAARSLPDTYFAGYSADRDLDRYVRYVADFFHAAFADSLWAALDQNRDASQREAIGARFDALLRQRIAADPETAACRWHVVVLDIARL